MERQAGASGRSANRPSAIDLIAAVMTCKAVVILGPLARASLHRRIISPRANTRCVNVGRNIRAVAGPFEDQYARRERLGHNTSAAELGADEVAESNLVSFVQTRQKDPSRTRPAWITLAARHRSRSGRNALLSRPSLGNGQTRAGIWANVATSKRGGMSETRKLAAILVADGLRSGDPLGQARRRGGGYTRRR
jgi:hypothetical protein